MRWHFQSRPINPMRHESLRGFSPTWAKKEPALRGAVKRPSKPFRGGTHGLAAYRRREANDTETMVSNVLCQKPYD